LIEGTIIEILHLEVEQYSVDTGFFFFFFSGVLLSQNG
jgi:hypothetical protein